MHSCYYGKVFSIIQPIIYILKITHLGIYIDDGVHLQSIINEQD